MKQQGLTPVSVALRGSSALELWRNLALVEARALDERNQRWERGDFTHDELPLNCASTILAHGRQHLPADYSLSIATREAEHLAAAYELTLPLNAQITSGAERRLTPAVRSRLLTLPSSPQFYLLEPGLFVASPPLALFDLASDAEETELLLTACELCSIYSPDPATGALLERPQIARVSDIEALAGQMGSAKGIRLASFAAKAALDRSRSPRESQLALLLSLPCSRGGYGLPQPLLNHPVALSPTAAGIYGRSSCECDLFFEKPRLAVFYDSEDTHLSVRQQHNDALRHNAFAVAGITELSVTNSQIKSPERMDRLAAVIAKACGKRRATTVRNYRARQYKLRRQLGI